MADAPEPRPSNLPPEGGDAPLSELGRDELSVFFFLAFTDEELTALLQELKLTVPGYRLEKLSGVQKADTLADEVRAVPSARAPAVALLRKVYEFPSLDVVTLTPPVAEELGALVLEDDALVRTLWRLLADPLKEVRQTAAPVLRALAKTYYGAPGSPGGVKPPSPAQERPQTPVEGVPDSKAIEAAERAAKKAEQAQEKAEQATQKAAQKVEALQGQLKESRAEAASTAQELAQARRAVEKAEAALTKTKEQLAGARAQAGLAELERLKKDLDKAAGAVAALEAQKGRLASERDALAAELEGARRAGAAAPVAPSAAEAPEAEDAAAEEAPTTWLLPRYTPEFYDSLEGWDVRLQRAAFKQAYLLSENHRHPSLRALPLEGLPGYYRVRVATDVRLIYRRSEAGEVEVLSLIDREDLDRYVRQAKTR